MQLVTENRLIYTQAKHCRLGAYDRGRMDEHNTISLGDGEF